MKKPAHIPRFLFFVPFVLGITFLLWNCEKEDFTAPLAIEKETSLYTQKTISISEIPEVKNYLDQKLNTTLFHRVDDENDILFNYESILEVTDTLQNTNYSFQFVFSDSPAGEFYNLVVGRAPTGELKEPLVFRYVCDEEQIDAFVLENYNINYFKGTITLHAYTDFFEQGSFSRTDEPCEPEYDDEGNIVGCAETTVNFSGSGGAGHGTSNGDNSWSPVGPGNGGYGGGSGGGGSFSCEWSFMTTPCSQGLSYPHEGGTYLEGTCNGSGLALGVECGWSVERSSNQNRVGGNCGDCTEPLGAVGVNTEEVNIDKVLIDDDFKENECLYSVYTAMGRATQFQEYLQNFEEDFSVADLRFTADENFSASEDVRYHNAMAITNPPLASNEILITFNTDPATSGNILETPDVFKAVAMIHEIIHAEMYRKMLDAVRAAEINSTTLQWDTWPNNTDFDDFIESLENKYYGIFDYYTRYEWDTPTPNDAQHQQMASHYRDIVKQALTAYDPTLTTAEKEALSWLGLNSADIVAWQNLDPNERAAINSLQTQMLNTYPNECD